MTEFKSDTSASSSASTSVDAKPKFPTPGGPCYGAQHLKEVAHLDEMVHLNFQTVTRNIPQSLCNLYANVEMRRMEPIKIINESWCDPVKAMMQVVKNENQQALVAPNDQIHTINLSDRFASMCSEAANQMAEKLLRVERVKTTFTKLVLLNKGCFYTHVEEGKDDTAPSKVTMVVEMNVKHKKRGEALFVQQPGYKRSLWLIDPDYSVVPEDYVRLRRSGKNRCRLVMYRNSSGFKIAPVTAGQKMLFVFAIEPETPSHAIAELKAASTVEEHKASLTVTPKDHSSSLATLFAKAKSVGFKRFGILCTHLYDHTDTAILLSSADLKGYDAKLYDEICSALRSTGTVCGSGTSVAVKLIPLIVKETQCFHLDLEGMIEYGPGTNDFYSLEAMSELKVVGCTCLDQKTDSSRLASNKRAKIDSSASAPDYKWEELNRQVKLDTGCKALKYGLENDKIQPSLMDQSAVKCLKDDSDYYLGDTLFVALSCSATVLLRENEDEVVGRGSAIVIDL